MATLAEFVDSSYMRNAWIETNVMRIYLRKGKRQIDGQLYTTFEVANIEVVEHLRGKGFFKEFLTYVENTYSMRFQCIYFENVLNSRLAQHLVLRGYTVQASPYVGQVQDLYILCWSNNE